MGIGLSQQTRKIVISGLDNAGKTSILAALNKKFDFENEIMFIKPTIRIDYYKTRFLRNECVFWDMGGQEIYREMYLKKDYIYFAETDLFVYVIDIQDNERIQESLEYLDVIMQYFSKNDMDVPIIVTFHKYDPIPEIREYPELNDDIDKLRNKIMETYPTFKMLFQQTSIYDIISIIQLISYGLSIFDKKFFELSLLLEKYVAEFNCESLILFDKNWIIISEYYKDEIDPDAYEELLKLIKEHLFLLKRMQEEDYKEDYNFTLLEKNYLSYLHSVKFTEETFFISVQIKDEYKNHLLEKFSDLIEEIIPILKAVLL